MQSSLDPKTGHKLLPHLFQFGMKVSANSFFKRHWFIENIHVILAEKNGPRKSYTAGNTKSGEMLHSVEILRCICVFRLLKLTMIVLCEHST